VNIHHLNGKVEKRIRYLQEKTRVIFLHTINQWPNTVALHLWPYALQVENKIRNITPRTQDGLSPWTLFARTKEIPSLDRIHPFGCPAYLLDNKLQQKKKINKWALRGRVGMYLGPSPSHSSTVHLILSIKMRNV